MEPTVQRDRTNVKMLGTHRPSSTTSRASTPSKHQQTQFEETNYGKPLPPGQSSPSYDGWLKRRVGRHWKKVWCSCSNERMSFAKKAGDDEEEHVALMDVTNIALPPTEPGSVLPQARFELHCLGGRSEVCMAPSRPEAQAWTQAIDTRCRHLRENSTRVMGWLTKKRSTSVPLGVHPETEKVWAELDQASRALHCYAGPRCSHGPRPPREIISLPLRSVSSVAMNATGSFNVNFKPPRRLDRAKANAQAPQLTQHLVLRDGQVNEGRHWVAALQEGIQPQLPHLQTSHRGHGEGPPATVMSTTLVATCTGSPVESRCLTAHAVQDLRALLPGRLRQCQWECAFSTAQHGTDMGTLCRRCHGRGAAVLVVKDRLGAVFGIFVPEDLSVVSHHGACGSFLFQCNPFVGPNRSEVQPFPLRSPAGSVCSTGRLRHISFDPVCGLVIGDRHGPTALSVTSDMMKGTSACSPLFGNSILSATPNFDVAEMEVWTFRRVASVIGPLL